VRTDPGREFGLAHARPGPGRERTTVSSTRAQMADLREGTRRLGLVSLAETLRRLLDDRRAPRAREGTT
jgi:hypothetical protein